MAIKNSAFGGAELTGDDALAIAACIESPKESDKAKKSIAIGRQALGLIAENNQRIAYKAECDEVLIPRAMAGASATKVKFVAGSSILHLLSLQINARLKNV